MHKLQALLLRGTCLS